MNYLCKLCGKQGEIQDEEIIREWNVGLAHGVPQSVLESFAERFAPGLCHKACADQEEQNNYAKWYQDRKYTLKKAWEAVNPFRDPTDWHKIPYRAKEVAARLFAPEEGQKTGHSMILSGLTGLGKSRLVYLLCMVPHMQNLKVIIGSHLWFESEYQRYQQSSKAWVVAFTKKLKECDILCIDDFGKAKMCDANGQGLLNEEQLFEVLDHRLSRNMQTIITTNDDGETLKKRMSADRGEPLVRRIRDYMKNPMKQSAAQ